MNTEDVARLYAYNRWANRRALADARSLHQNDFTRNLGSSFPSIHATLVHTMWAEWIWARRWQGESPRRRFTAEEFPDVAAIEKQWSEVERDQQTFIGTLTKARLSARLGYENLQGQHWEYTLRDMMQHVVNHATYHRGQVVTMLRQLGHAPQPTDFLVYFDESE